MTLLRNFLLSVMALLSICPMVSAQKPEPTHKNVRYDDKHRAQVLDVYLNPQGNVVPVVIFIHGGGWEAGSKDQLPRWLLAATHAGFINTVSVEYRFTQVAKHPAQVEDCTRAVQFVRANAEKWKIDPERIGLIGGSAGAHLSLWVALHDDQADPQAKDPVSRQSSRVSCVVSLAGPTDFSLLTKYEHKHQGFYGLMGVRPGTPPVKISEKIVTEVSPITFASKDDPPVLLVYGGKDDIVPLEHATRLERKLKTLGVDVHLEVHPRQNHRVAGGTLDITKTPGRWLAVKLKIPPPKK